MSETNPPALPVWSSRRVIGTTLVVLLVLFGFWLLYRFHMVLFIVFAALVLGVAIRPPVDWLYSRGLHRAVGVILVYLALLAFLAGFVWLVVPLVADQITTISARLPDYYDSIRHLLTSSRNLLIQRLFSQLPAAWAPRVSTPTPETGSLNAIAQVLGYSRMFLRSLFTLIAILLIAFYWTLDSERAIRALLLRLPPGRREGTRDLITEIEARVGAYVRGVAIMCSTVGIMALIAYLIIGLPYALVLGLIAAVLEAVPMVGPVLGALPPALLALSMDPSKVIWVIVATVVIQQIESNLLVPRVMDRAVGVNSIVTILALLSFGTLLGLPGALLAVPLAAIIQLLMNRLVLEPDTPEEMPERRDRVGMLRYAAQELVQDVRKQIRRKEDKVAGQADQAEDNIEAIATDLDSTLALKEKQRDEP